MVLILEGVTLIICKQKWFQPKYLHLLSISAGLCINDIWQVCLVDSPGAPEDRRLVKLVVSDSPKTGVAGQNITLKCFFSGRWETVYFIFTPSHYTMQYQFIIAKVKMYFQNPTFYESKLAFYTQIRFT